MAIEQKLGISIDVEELKEKHESGIEGQEIRFEANVTKKAVELYMDENMKDKDVDIYVNDELLMSARTGKDAVIKISKKHKIGKFLSDSFDAGEKVKLVI